MNRCFAAVLVVLGIVHSVAGVPCVRAAGPGAPDHAVLTTLLAKYVSAGGVDYRGWSANAEDRGALRGYIAGLERAAPSRLERGEALAYWINLYNAVTLDLVLENYPLKSIKDVGAPLSSPWKQDLVTVEGKALSLDRIENDVIRPSFLEPRIHFALSCAARSCPPLRAEAYAAASLEAQLEEQTAHFLADATTNSLDEKGVLRLSKLFEWYEGDFREAKGSVVAFVTPYVPALRALGPEAKPPAVQFVEYDWALNEASKAR